MSWENAGLENVEGIRKVKWDRLWHVMYEWGGRDTWDRVTKKEAMAALRKIERRHTIKLKKATKRYKETINV